MDKVKRKRDRKVKHRRLRRLARKPDSFEYFVACVVENINPELFLKSRLYSPFINHRKYEKLVRIRMHS